MKPLDPQRREIAIEVLAGTKMVQKWVKSQLSFLNVDKASPDYEKHRLRLARQQAVKIIDDR